MEEAEGEMFKAEIINSSFHQVKQIVQEIRMKLGLKIHLTVPNKSAPDKDKVLPECERVSLLSLQ